MTIGAPARSEEEWSRLARMHDGDAAAKSSHHVRPRAHRIVRWFDSEFPPGPRLESGMAPQADSDADDAELSETQTAGGQTTEASNSESEQDSENDDATERHQRSCDSERVGSSS